MIFSHGFLEIQPKTSRNINSNSNKQFLSLGPPGSLWILQQVKVMEIREAEERYLVRKRCTTRYGGGDDDDA